MKNDLHLAYKTTQNFPLHISSLDSVRAHVNDDVRLISMLPAEWPKVRGRDIVRKNYTVDNTYELAGKTVEHITFNATELHVAGKLVDGKYFFTDAVLNQSMDLEMMFTPFAELGLKPMVRREWSWDYPSSNPFWYTLVEKDVTVYKGVEDYYPVRGYQSADIYCLADLLAYSYKFGWDNASQAFVLITDEHEISKRLRKPWMQYLVQWRFGEAPATEADHGKLISFLISKAVLSDEEKNVLSPFIDRTVTLNDLQRLASRQQVLNEILDAYNSNYVLKVGAVFEDDPLFALY